MPQTGKQLSPIAVTLICKTDQKKNLKHEYFQITAWNIPKQKTHKVWRLLVCYSPSILLWRWYPDTPSHSSPCSSCASALPMEAVLPWRFLTGRAFLDTPKVSWWTEQGCTDCKDGLSGTEGGLQTELPVFYSDLFPRKFFTDATVCSYIEICKPLPLHQWFLS